MPAVALPPDMETKSFARRAKGASSPIEAAASQYNAAWEDRRPMQRRKFTLLLGVPLMLLTRADELIE
ncbi:MAG: hypothetical protein U1E60_26335 [Reyranellaceae bacterium]